VNAISFRAAALVRAVQESLRPRLEFMQMSAGGRHLLEDLIARLARLQALNRRLRSEQAEDEVKQGLLGERSWAASLGTGRLFVETMETDKSASELVDTVEIVERPLKLIEIDLLG
jgi:hypothetical protein